MYVRNPQNAPSNPKTAVNFILKKTKNTWEAKPTGQHMAQSQLTLAQTSSLLAKTQTNTKPNSTKSRTKSDHNQIESNQI